MTDKSKTFAMSPSHADSSAVHVGVCSRKQQQRYVIAPKHSRCVRGGR